MKILALMRHGKSSWEHEVSDRERPLKSRGVNDALLVSEAFRTKGFLPEIVLSSPANRALSTCKIFSIKNGIADEDIQIEERLYDFIGQDVINIVKSLDDRLESAIVFGHNHAFTSIANVFGSVYIDNLPTSGLVVIDFEVDSWKQIASGITRFTIFPRDLK